MKIAVYAICKNEKTNCFAWYDSVKEADRIIVADTGSMDGCERWATHKIHVEPFRFDVARNAALALVPPDVDVCVSLDLDERLEPGWRGGIERVWAQYPDTTRLGVRYQTAGLQEFVHNSRVHTRNGWYWRDPCHEAIYPWIIDDNVVVAGGVKINHAPDRLKPRDRLNLLAAGIHEEPWNRRRMFYYGRELVLVGENEKAVGWLNKYLDLWAKSGEKPWWESEQAEAYLTLALGCIKEKASAVSLR